MTGRTPASVITVCTPMRMEYRALRPAPSGVHVEHTGVGRRATLPSSRPLPAAAVAVVGLAGGLAPQCLPGDVVVADRVRSSDPAEGEIPCPSAGLLATRMRAGGMRVHVGAVVTADRVITGAARARLASKGDLAVDMESHRLLRDAAAPAVIRVVADQAGAGMLRPATLGSIRRALRVLPQLVPALEDWAAAIDDRRVLLAEPRSFCAGVDRAIEVVERALAMYDEPVYVRKQIVHNAHVVADLQRRGAVFVDELDQVPKGAPVVFSAHGVSPAVRDAASSSGLDVIDATCPLVTKVHSEVRRFADRGDTVIFIGHAGHEETEGTMGERPARTVIVETAADAEKVVVDDPSRVTYLVQTTLSVHDVNSIVDVLRRRFPDLKAPPSDDICYATTNRQEALTAVAERADTVLVIGSSNSSNSRRLVETAQRLGARSYLIDDASDIDLRWLRGARRVAITAGASAPPDLVDGVIDALRGIGPVEVETHRATTENVHFNLPKEVRTA